MTAIITWNIQCGKGVDEVIDLARIAAVVKALGDADVICLQEVARFDPDLDQGTGADQATLLAEHFPGFSPCYGAAVDRIGRAGGPRRAFGNLVLTRRPVAQVFHHALPQPAQPDVKHMPRQATEVVVDAVAGPLRVMTTHLEYHSARHRDAQVARLRALQAEVCANARSPARPAGGPYAAHPRPPTLVLCGDFNCVVADDQYRHMCAPATDGDADLRDAWTLAHPDREHAPTCGIFDRAQWEEGPHCRDFFFVSADLAARVREVQVDVRTDASDHQPLRLVLG